MQHQPTTPKPGRTTRNTIWTQARLTMAPHRPPAFVRPEEPAPKHCLRLMSLLVGVSGQEAERKCQASTRHDCRSGPKGDQQMASGRHPRLIPDRAEDEATRDTAVGLVADDVHASVSRTPPLWNTFGGDGDASVVPHVIHDIQSLWPLLHAIV